MASKCALCGKDYDFAISYRLDPDTRERVCIHDGVQTKSYWQTEAGKDAQRSYEQMAKMERELN